MASDPSPDDIRLYTVQVRGETASGLTFTETRRVVAFDTAGAKSGAAKMFPGCRLLSVEVESASR